MLISLAPADNPAPWILHCHIEWHLEGGLAVVCHTSSSPLTPYSQISLQVFVEDPDSIRNDPIQPPLAYENLCPIYNALAPELQ